MAWLWLYISCMKTRHIIIIIMGLLAGLGAHGQEAWTLDHCMAYAQEHATEVRRQKLEQKQRRADYRASLLNFLPSVSAEATGQYSWGRNIDPETNTYNNVTTFNNYYQVGASVTLFDGGATWNAFRQARLDRTAAQSYVDKARDDVAMGVMAKYVDAVYTQRCIGLTEEKLRGSRALLVKTQRMFELGEKSRPDVVQVQSQVEEDEYNLLHQRNLAEKALADLKTAMNYPAADTLVVAGLPVDVAVASILPASRQACDSLMAHGFFLADRPAVVAAEAEAERARLAWKIQRASLMPKLTLGGGVATNYYKNLSSGGRADGFGSQFRNNMGEYVYLSLTIPIFNPSARNKVFRAKTDWQKARLDVEAARRKQHDDALQAVLDYRGYAREVVQLERKVASDSLAHHLSYRKYEEGMLSVFDLHTASQNLLQSRLQLLQSEMLLVLKARLVNYYITGELGVRN